MDFPLPGQCYESVLGTIVTETPKTAFQSSWMVTHPTNEYLRFGGLHLRFSTSGYLHFSDYHSYNTGEIFVAYNVGVGDGSLLPVSLEPKITYMSYAVDKFSFVHYFRFGAAILVIGWVLNLAYSVYTILYVHHFQCRSYERTAKIVVSGYIYPPRTR